VNKMDLAETTQRIAWLDEARRADQQLLTELQKQVDAQSAIISDLNRRLEALTVELTRTRGELDRFDRLEVALTQTRDDLLRRLADEANDRQAAEEKAHEQVTAQTTLLSELSRLVQSLQNGMTQVQSRLTHLPARVDEQVTQAAALAREVESLESRLTHAQSQATNLDGRLSQQTDQVAQLLRQLQALESRLTQTQAQLTRFAQIEDALARVKGELTGLIKEQETRWREDMANFAQARQRERDVDGRTVASIVRQLEILPRLQERIQAWAIEDKRITEMLQGLEARDAELETTLDQKAGRLPYIDERLKRESDRINALEQQSRALAESIQARTARVPYLDEQVARYAERLATLERGIPVLEKTIQDKTASIPYLAELIDGNTERVDTLEPELVNVKRRGDEQADKIRFLDGWAQRSAQKIDELERFEARLQEAHDKLVEQMQFGDAARTRQMEAWAAELAQHRQQLDAWAKELKRYAEMYEWARTTTQAVDELSKQLARQQQELAERQRLEMERQKNALEAWEAEWTKQWKLFLKQRDWKWGEQAKLDQGQTGRIEQLETWRQQDYARADGLEKQLQDQEKAHLQRTADLWRAFEDYAKHRLGELKKWLEEIDQTRAQSLRSTSLSPKSQVQAPKVGPESMDRR
jgi:chromosome segregation ATPase